MSSLKQLQHVMGEIVYFGYYCYLQQSVFRKNVFLTHTLLLFQSYRYNPTNISVIEWLGAYYIDSQFCEKAIQYFDRAAIIQ